MTQADQGVGGTGEPPGAVTACLHWRMSQEAPAAAAGPDGGGGALGGGLHYPGERMPVCQTSCGPGEPGGGAARNWREMGWRRGRGVSPPLRFREAASASCCEPARAPRCPEDAPEHPPSPLLGPQQQPGSREAGSFQRSVVWVCLCFCSRELRFISLKHPISRHPAICSVLR